MRLKRKKTAKVSSDLGPLGQIDYTKLNCFAMGGIAVSLICDLDEARLSFLKGRLDESNMYLRRAESRLISIKKIYPEIEDLTGSIKKAIDYLKDGMKKKANARKKYELKAQFVSALDKAHTIRLEMRESCST